jgi:hypothetical protein
MITPEEAKAAEEAGKAVQELAKAAVAYQPTMKQVGEFFGRLVSPIEQSVGMLADHLKYKRLELAIEQEQRIARLMDQRGVKAIRPMPLAVALPLIDAAVIEEDEDLADMFANLIVSHIDASHDEYLPKQFTQSLKQMTPYEAVILKAMGNAPSNCINESGIMYTAMLPNAFLKAPGAQDQDVPQPSEKLELALASLQQMGCVQGAMTWGGTPTFSNVAVTAYGHALLRACAPG